MTTTGRVVPLGEGLAVDRSPDGDWLDLYCRWCKKQRSMFLPMNGNMVIEMVRGFAREHVTCGSGKADVDVVA